MKKILFIVPYPEGCAPSQRFRFEQYFKSLKENHFDYKVKSFWSENAWQILYNQGRALKKTWFLIQGIIKRIILLFSLYKYDFVFIHREAMPVGPPVFEFITSRIFRKKIIYDFDDAIWLPNTSQQNSLASKIKWHQKVASIIKWSWKISCGNQFLADYAKKIHSNVVVNPTTINTDYHRPINYTNEKITIGWTGTHSTAKYLNSIQEVLVKLRKKHNFSLLIISNQKPNWEIKDFEFIPWSLDDEIEVLNKIDIGIMPLKDTIWEKGKCGFKALQYMSLEIPTVASAVGVNNQIIDSGENGYLCKNEDDWLNYLSKLIVSKSLRDQMGKAGRTTVESKYSVQSNTTLFLSLFE